MQSKEILRQLRAQRDPKNVAGMAQFGINPHNTLGVSIPTLRRIARQGAKDHRVAQELWRSGIHEARILAALVDMPERVTEAQMERWVKDFDSWDVCDQVCSNLFDKTRFARRKAIEWSKRDEEFVKRAGFVMMAALAVHDKTAPDGVFRKFLPLIQRGATDDRNFVKKAVNWALRQIGKRNAALNRAAQATAREIQAIDSKAARWIAADALRELRVKARDEG
jgi:3-methyladenine DNA glycosylase AlkD